MSEVVAVLVGVVLSLFVTPFIERRVRARERWEQDLLALGEALSTDLMRCRSELWDRWLSWDVLQELAASGPLDQSSKKFTEIERERLEEAKSPARAMRELVEVRLSWLVARVTASLPATLQLRWMEYRVRSGRIWSTHLWTAALRDEIREAWNLEDEARKRLLADVEALAVRIGPKQSIRHRLTSRWRRWWNHRTWRRAVVHLTEPADDGTGASETQPSATADDGH